MKSSQNSKSRIVFDPIYGFIHLTNPEWEIIQSPFYQRLRWIKQLGFSFYVFPGAEHSRFGHSIGVLHNADAILKSCHVAVSEDELFDDNNTSEKTMFHKSLRVAALMHDLGTFPFSHTTEMSYIDFGETTRLKNGKGLNDDHENLGSYIIKNTDYDGGITQILKRYGFDPQNISDLVKGVDPSVLANQILHSEIDCDRMDYLLRDAHYTGLKYGSYDRDYLLHHFQIANVGGKDILTLKENSLHCVEDFLFSRFAWYSQVIRSPRGAKYDAIAERVCFYLLEKNLIHKYSDLLDMVSSKPLHFYQFNDMYFMNLVHHHYVSETFDKDPHIKDMAGTLLFQKGARVLRGEEFKQQLLDQDDHANYEKLIKKAEEKVVQCSEVIKKKGKKSDWIISDLPKKDIIFVKSENKIAKGSLNVLHERDPVKISYENGEVKLLAQVENSIISKLSKNKNFLPNVFCSDSAYNLLVDEGILAPD